MFLCISFFFFFFFLWCKMPFPWMNVFLLLISMSPEFSDPLSLWPFNGGNLTIKITNYKGKSISNQPIPFPIDQTPKIFMPCFNTCFRPEGKIAPLSCHSLIRYWMSNMASNAKVSFSSKVEYHAVIRYLYLKGKTGQEICCELTNVYGSYAPSYAR